MPLFRNRPDISAIRGSMPRNAFLRLLNSDGICFGVRSSSPLLCNSDISTRLRYAPMQRLLARSDIKFLEHAGCRRVAAKLRHEHRQCYWQFLAELRSDIRKARRLRSLAMASAGNWDFRSLLAYTLLSECSLLYLGWLGCRHSLGMPSPAGGVTECLNFLLTAPKLHAAAT